MSTWIAVTDALPPIGWGRSGGRMTPEGKSMDIEFEGRPLDLGDTLLLQTNDRPERVKVMVWELQTWWADDSPNVQARYTLRECARSKHGFAEHRLSLVDLKARCIRDPEDRERRKGERRKQMDTTARDH